MYFFELLQVVQTLSPHYCFFLLGQIIFVIVSSGCSLAISLLQNLSIISGFTKYLLVFPFASSVPFLKFSSYSFSFIKNLLLGSFLSEGKKIVSMLEYQSVRFGKSYNRLPLTPFTYVRERCWPFVDKPIFFIWL